MKDLFLSLNIHDLLRKYEELNGQFDYSNNLGNITIDGAVLSLNNVRIYEQRLSAYCTFDQFETFLNALNFKMYVSISDIHSTNQRTVRIGSKSFLCLTSEFYVFIDSEEETTCLTLQKSLQSAA